MLITLVVVTLISFLLVRLSPIDPAEAYARRSFAAFSFTDEQMEALREDMGLNDPLPVQYATWVRDALHLDFGKSFVSGQPVFEKVTTAIGITVTIVLISAVIQAVFILLIGCLCYLTRKRMIGHALIFLCIAGVSIPSFFFASTYLDIFAVKLGLTSVAGNTGLMRYLPAAVCIGIGCIALFSPMLANNIQKEMEQEEEENETDIHLNLLVDATPEATMKIIMDPVAGDYISGRGSGNIRTEFYNKGDVRMFGSYRINQGIYKFSLQEVIRKDFIIKDGSTITFNGSPLNATLDISASYTVNSASLNDLISNASAYVDQTNVKVNCLMNLTGQLTSPDIKLGLELPNERDEVQALVRNYIPTDEQMNMQILYLLSIGKFSPENVDGTQNSDMMSSVLSSTLSGQLNNALSHIINSNNWNFGTNFSTGEKGWTDVEFETMLSGQLLNNRLLINGNFGYRDNPLANTNFVGDFDAEWLVNRSGDIRLKAYNETNDRYYTKTNLTTQGIGIIFKKDFNKWNELFFWNKWLQRRKQKKQATNDSIAIPAIAPAQSKVKREGR